MIQTGIILDGRNEVVVDLAAPGWGWEVTDGGSGPGFGVVRCRVTGRSDVPVHLWTDGWEGITQRTGSKAEFGTDACEFAPLGVGRYLLRPEGTDVVAEVIADGRRVLWVTFTEHVGQAPRKGVIAGRVTNGGGRIIAFAVSPDCPSRPPRRRLRRTGTIASTSSPPAPTLCRFWRASQEARSSLSGPTYGWMVQAKWWLT